MDFLYSNNNNTLVNNNTKLLRWSIFLNIHYKLQKRVYRSQIRDVDQLKSRPIEEWEHFHQVVIHEAVRQWRPRLRACVRLRAHSGHFEQTLGVLKSCHLHGRTLESQSRLCL